MTRFLEDVGPEALQTGEMLDVGFEDGSGTRAFLDAGWTKAHAIDVDERCRPMLDAEVAADRASVQIGRIQDVDLPANVDVVYAHFVLPFVVDGLPDTLQRLYNATRPGGYLLCGFMAADHSWSGKSGIRVYDQSQIAQMLSAAGYRNITITPHRRENIVDQAGKTVANWSVFIVRAQTALEETATPAL